MLVVVAVVVVAFVVTGDGDPPSDPPGPAGPGTPTTTSGSSAIPTTTPPASSSGTAPTGASTRPPGATTEPTPPTYTVTAHPGVPASSETHPQRPGSITLPSGTTVPVEIAETSADGLLTVPDDINRAGWWNGSARLGDPYGAIVLASHVDSTTQGIGPFAELLGVHQGEQVALSSVLLEQEFTIDTIDLVPKVDLDTRGDLFATGGPHQLVLMTCAGPYDADDGGYQNLAVVTATPADPVRPG